MRKKKKKIQTSLFTYMQYVAFIDIDADNFTNVVEIEYDDGKTEKAEAI